MAVEHPVHLVFDCDPGIDDALALAVVAAHVRAGRAVLHALVAVGGNVGLDHTAANAAFLAARFGLDVPVLAGAAVPLAGSVPGDAAHVHGADGIGGLRQGAGPGLAAAIRPATPAELVDVVASLPSDGGERVLLATGPLTDVARMVQVDPALARRLDRVVVMGGAFGHPAGNVTAHAEFNAWVDPEAWSVVAAAGLPLDVVPLDVTTRVVLDASDAAALAGSGDRPSLVSRLVSVGAELSGEVTGRPTCEMHDPLAAAVVFDPGLLEWSTGEVEVTLAGEARGRTSWTGSTPSVDGSGGTRVALGVPAERARASLLADLAAVRDP